MIFLTLDRSIFDRLSLLRLLQNRPWQLTQVIGTGASMTFSQTLKYSLLGGLCFTSGIAVTVAVGKTPHQPSQVLLSSSQSSLGQDLGYPSGKPTITAAIVTLQPGESTGKHRHDVPMFAMILEGEVTVDYGPDGTQVYAQGDTLLEAFKTYHNGTNTGPTPTRILAVFAGSDTAKNTVMQN